jgi:aminoglycoside phosphotransferase (APT) family kinase protein
MAEMDRGEITADVAARLVAAQFPQWAGLPVTPVTLNGHDNTTFRLGDELSLRLPSADSSVAQVAKEHRWLPFLARHLPASRRSDLGPQPRLGAVEGARHHRQGEESGENAQAAARRFGWRHSPRTIIGIVIADHGGQRR